VNSLRLIRDKGSDDSWLQILVDRHPARVVRTTAAAILRELPFWRTHDKLIHD